MSGYVSTDYIFDSIKHNKLQDLKNYRLVSTFVSKKVHTRIFYVTIICISLFTDVNNMKMARIFVLNEWAFPWATGLGFKDLGLKIWPHWCLITNLNTHPYPGSY